MKSSQQQFIHSLAFRIGAIIVLTEVVIFTITGMLYINNFNAEVDRRIAENVLLPATLMSEGVLELDVVTDDEQMRRLVREELINAFVIGANGNIFFSLNEEYIGRRLNSIPTINPDLFTPHLAEPLVRQDPQTGHIFAIAPLFGSDGRSLRFYTYIEVSTAAAAAQKINNIWLFVVGSLGTMGVTSLVILVVFNFAIFNHLQNILVTLRQVEAGDLTARLNGATQRDELGTLQRGLNAMIERLQELFETLEQRVAERTRDLKVAIDISNQLASILDLDKLLQHVVDQVQTEFGFYHIHIYLLEPASSQLAVVNGSGEVGRQMAAKKHHLDVGQGIVGQVAQTGQSFLINDVAKMSNFIRNPLLPHTQAELAVPVHKAGQILGVLDIQSEHKDSFNEAHRSLMQSIADQLAIAIANVRLFEEIEQARKAAETAKETADQAREAADVARKKAEVANRAKSEFLSNMSHELRTPLNGILGYAQILKNSEGLLARQIKGVDIIRQSGEHLLNLINDILDLAKIEAQKIELTTTEVYLPGFLENIVAMFRLRAEEKGLAFDFYVSSLIPATIKVDEKRLRQILINLLGNAFKFTKTGRVVFSVTNLEQIETAGPYPTAKLRFEVQDTGVGMSSEALSRIFIPFEQVGSKQQQIQGTGLGLAISQKLAQMMDSQVQVKSELNRGSVFWFSITVPVVDAGPLVPVLPSPPQKIVGYKGQQREVLVVDDNVTNLALVVDLLEPLGFKVVGITNGPEAIDYVQYNRPDLILMDIRMPGMNGFEVTQAIRYHLIQKKMYDQKQRLENFKDNLTTPAHNVVIIAASASTFERDQRKSGLSGCDDFIAKPIKAEELLELLRSYLHIEWLYKEIEEEAKEVETGVAKLVVPPPEEMAMLLDLARSGRMRKIRERATHLIELNEQYRPFATKLQELAQNFQEKALLALIEQYPGETP